MQRHIAVGDVRALQTLRRERRLFYVGITRARDELILTYPGEPSPFLAEIPSGAVTSGGAAPKKALPEGEQLSLF